MRWIGRQSRLLQNTQRSFSTASDSLILTETHNGYSIIRLNNPPVNILSRKLFETLDATIAKLESEKSCRGMILASSTPRVFSAGLDLSELYQPHPTKVKIFYESLYKLYTRLYTTRLACVAAIEGHSPAGGCILAMCCDYRIMATGKAKIGLNETQLGFIVLKWVRDIFVNTVGHRQAERLLGLGLQLDAMKAKAVGMVDEACEVDEVLSRSKAAMEKWLAIPDHARVGTKRLMRQDTADRIEETKKEDLEAFLDMAQTDKVQKALGFYLEALKNKAKSPVSERMDEIREELLLGRKFYDLNDYFAAHDTWKHAFQSACESCNYPLMYVLSTNLGDVLSKFCQQPSKVPICTVQQAMEYYDYAEAIAETCGILYSPILQSSLDEIKRKKNRLTHNKKETDTLQFNDADYSNKRALQASESEQYKYSVDYMLSLRDGNTQIPQELDSHLFILSPAS